MAKIDKQIDKHYVSKIDQEMKKFDLSHPKSAAQLAEIDKYKQIYASRDFPAPTKPMDDELWD